MGEHEYGGEGEPVKRGDELADCFMGVFLGLIQSVPARYASEEELGKRNGVPECAAMPSVHHKDFTFEVVCQKAGDIVKQLDITGDVFFEASDAYYAPSQDDEEQGYYPPEVTIFMERDEADFACILNLMPDGTVTAKVHNEDSEFNSEVAYEEHPKDLSITTNEAHLLKKLAAALFQQSMSLTPPHS